MELRSGVVVVEVLIHLSTLLVAALLSGTAPADASSSPCRRDTHTWPGTATYLCMRPVIKYRGRKSVWQKNALAHRDRVVAAKDSRLSVIQQHAINQISRHQACKHSVNV